MRVENHPILGPDTTTDFVTITVDGQQYSAKRGEMIAAVMMANNLMTHRYTEKYKHPRGVFCGIGQCTDCVMVVNGVPNVRTCITPVEEGMVIETQYGDGKKGGQK